MSSSKAVLASPRSQTVPRTHKTRTRSILPLQKYQSRVLSSSLSLNETSIPYFSPCFLSSTCVFYQSTLPRSFFQTINDPRLIASLKSPTRTRLSQSSRVRPRKISKRTSFSSSQTPNRTPSSAFSSARRRLSRCRLYSPSLTLSDTRVEFCLSK